jgi:hypothetical protein
MPIDFNEAPLINDRRLDETVTIPLFDEFSGPASNRPRFRYLE